MYELVGIICVIVLGYVIWQQKELKKFCITNYVMATPKVNSEIKAVVISDLHSFSYGEGNERLLQAVYAANPDLILIPGDLIVTEKVEKYDIALHFVQDLCKRKIPVVCSNGNHESRAQLSESGSCAAYMQYCRQLEEAGVSFLNNTGCKLMVNGVQVCICGLELPLYSYKKGKKPYLEEGFLESKLGKASEKYLQLLLAHNPAFAEVYAAWGADITVCGHNHGGLVRIPGIGSIISPQFVLFPKYDAGEFTICGKKIYISRGMGTHTFHIRIFNRAELMVITIKPGTLNV